MYKNSLFLQFHTSLCTLVFLCGARVFERNLSNSNRFKNTDSDSGLHLISIISMRNMPDIAKLVDRYFGTFFSMRNSTTMTIVRFGRHRRLANQ